MYTNKKMLDLSSVKPRTDKHRNIAEQVCMFNPMITTVSSMTTAIEKINTILYDELETITWVDIDKLLQAGQNDLFQSVAECADTMEQIVNALD